VAQGVAAGLAHLHARGLVHRDLKPANVMFDEEDRPKLADFGLARSTAGAGTLTEAGTVLGTAAYISPEQASGEPAGAASDVYSFGVILFRMLTGALPFTADDAIALVEMHRHSPPPPVELLQPNAPRDLAALTAATLRKDPAERPADGAALLAAVGTTASTVLIPPDTEATRVIPAPVSVPVPAPPPPKADQRRKWALVAAAVVLLAAAGGILAWAVTRPGSATPVVTTSGTKSHTHPTTTQPVTPSTTTAATSTQPTTTAPPTTTATTARTTTTTPTIPTTTATETIPTTITTPTTTTSTTVGVGTTTTATGTP
jgi:serine/threonine-protein kinase